MDLIFIDELGATVGVIYNSRIMPQIHDTINFGNLRYVITNRNLLVKSADGKKDNREIYKIQYDVEILM